MKHSTKEKWLYLGFIPEQKVQRIPISDFTTRFEMVSQGWGFTTKEAYDTYVKFNGGVKIFTPTTHAGITVYSHVYYTARMIKKLQNG